MKKLLLVLALVAGTAHAEFWDGNKMFDKLNGTSYYEQGLAMGYIMGVADTTVGISHCAPPNTTAGQLEAMVVQHLRLYPERRTKTGDAIVIDVLKAAWPCPARNGRAL